MYASISGMKRPQTKSTGRVRPQATPIISEAEFAGMNSGLEILSRFRIEDANFLTQAGLSANTQ